METFFFCISVCTLYSMFTYNKQTDSIFISVVFQLDQNNLIIRGQFDFTIFSFKRVIFCFWSFLGTENELAKMSKSYFSASYFY